MSGTCLKTQTFFSFFREILRGKMSGTCLKIPTLFSFLREILKCPNVWDLFENSNIFLFSQRNPKRQNVWDLFENSNIFFSFLREILRDKMSGTCLKNSNIFFSFLREILTVKMSGTCLKIQTFFSFLREIFLQFLPQKYDVDPTMNLTRLKSSFTTYRKKRRAPSLTRTPLFKREDQNLKLGLVLLDVQAIFGRVGSG